MTRGWLWGVHERRGAEAAVSAAERCRDYRLLCYAERLWGAEIDAIELARFREIFARRYLR